MPVWLFITLLCILFISCEEDMNISLSGDAIKRLVVEGSITTDTTSHKVVLSYSGDYLSSTIPEMATGAEVSISSGIDTFYLTEIPAGSGIYLTDPDVYGLPDKTYTLNIRLSDGQEYSASDYLYPCTKIDSITQSANYYSFDYYSYTPSYGYDVNFYANEPEPLGNCYLFLLYLNDTLYSDTITQVHFENDDYVNGNYISDLVAYRIFEKDISDSVYAEPELYEIYPDSVYVTLELHSTSRGFYDFMYRLMLETAWKGSPFDGPPANIPSNVSNDGLGFFRASDVRRTSRYFYASPRVN